MKILLRLPYDTTSPVGRATRVNGIHYKWVTAQREYAATLVELPTHAHALDRAGDAFTKGDDLRQLLVVHSDEDDHQAFLRHVVDGTWRSGLTNAMEGMYTPPRPVATSPVLAEAQTEMRVQIPFHNAMVDPLTGSGVAFDLVCGTNKLFGSDAAHSQPTILK